MVQNDEPIDNFQVNICSKDTFVVPLSSISHRIREIHKITEV